VLAIVGVCFVMFVGLFFAIAIFVGYKDAKTAIAPTPSVSHHPYGGGPLGTYDDDGDDDDDEADEEDNITPGLGGKLPAVKRDIPHHDVKILSGCSDADLRSVLQQIDDAVEVGAPRYNRGDFQGCYETYVSTSRDIESDLPKTCVGPITALKTARDKAMKLSSPSERAWAMRDGFDGLVDVIERRGPSL
jgi:hypothetical protein